MLSRFRAVSKDSTCLLLTMLERGEPIHSVVWFDTGWEFPQMYEHIDKLEQYVGFEFVRLKPNESFYYRMMERPIMSPKRAKVPRYIGRGWPSLSRRWCTRDKVQTIDKYIRSIREPVIQCIGFSIDEVWRGQSVNLKRNRFQYRYPLQEYDVTEQQALAYCMDRGFNWGGLYEVFNRVSCFCCPLQRLSELRKLRRHYPDLWTTMLKWDREMPDNRGFRGYMTVNDLEARFKAEEAQLLLPGLEVTTNKKA